LVVHEALLMTWCFCGSNSPSFTPRTIVLSSFFAGAEMITYFAPASRCALAFVASVKKPVDSITTSTPRSRHGSLDGSRSCTTLMRCPALNRFAVERISIAYSVISPGVTGVATSMVPLLAGSNWGTGVYVQGFPSGPDVDNESRFNEVGAGYFRMMGIPLLAGREFTDADALGGARVAVVNETFARKFNLGRNPLHTFMSTRGQDSLNIEIVGLAQDAKYSDVKDSIPPLFFIPWRQDSDVGFMNFYARTPLDATTQMRAIADLLRRLAPTVPVEDLKTMPDQIRENVFLDRLISILSAVFASLATLLAAVGLYGVLAYTVQQRTREIGVRMALGADAGQVRLLVLRQVGVMIALGGVLGIGAALGLGRLLRSLLFGLEGHDPAVFVTSLAVLGVVAFGATYVPVRRASRIDPLQALRYE